MVRHLRGCDNAIPLYGGTILNDFPAVHVGACFARKANRTRILAISALRHCSLASIVFMLVPLSRFGDISRNTLAPCLLLSFVGKPIHEAEFSLDGAGVQCDSILFKANPESSGSSGRAES